MMRAATIAEAIQFVSEEIILLNISEIQTTSREKPKNFSNSHRHIIQHNFINFNSHHDSLNNKFLQILTSNRFPIGPINIRVNLNLFHRKFSTI